VRLTHVWSIRHAPFFETLLGDAHGYDAWARRIAAGDLVGQGAFYQAPLYAYFLGALYAIHRSLALVRICQAALGAGACALVALATRRMFSTTAGVVAGVMLALYAPAIFFDALIQKSALDLFLVALFVALVARPAAASSTRWVAVGLTLGALSLTRENALLFVPVVVAWVCLAGRSIGRSRVAVVSLVLAGVAVVVLPVGLRNRIVGGELHLTTAQAGPNLYIGNHAGADGTYDPLRAGRGSPEYEQVDATEIAERALGHRASPGEVSRYWTSRALGFIAAQPIEWLALEARKLRLLLNRTEIIDTESQEAYEDYSPVLRLLSYVTHFGVLAPLAALGVWLTWGDRRRLWLLYALMATYATSVLAFYMVARYRMPLVPLLIVCAAAGAVKAFQLLRRSTPRSTHVGGAAIAGAAGLVAFTIFCNVPALSADVMRAITYQNLGAAFVDARQLDDAADAYQRAVILAPDLAPAHSGFGSVLRQQGRMDDAIQHLEIAVRLGPDIDDAWLNLANALADRGRLPEATRIYNDLLGRRPDDADVHASLGVALASAGRLDEAVVHLRRALALGPATAAAHYRLGHVLLTRGDRDDAVRELAQAVRSDPTNGPARYELGNAYLAQQQFGAAIEQFRWVVQLSPRMVEARNNLGIALGSAGRVDEAIEEFRQALVIDPESRDARVNLEAALALRRSAQRAR